MKKTNLTTSFGAKATIYHQGAHVTSWVPSPKHGEQLFVANQSAFSAGKAIRGGVPVCFPQFAAFGAGPKHGFARKIEWQLKNISQDHSEAIFTLAETEETLRIWPHAFALTFTVKLELKALKMTLDVHNTGDDSFEFSGALHTYFAVEDFTQSEVNNLTGITYWDNGTPLTDKKTYNPKTLAFDGAIDRVYFDAPDVLALNTPSSRRVISKTGFTDVVIWNPGPDGAKKLKDMSDEEYVHMLCVEAAIVDSPIKLDPANAWSGMQCIEINS